MQLICRTGGVAALAHPWALKNPVAVIRSLKAAGLHAMEVYRSDGKLAGMMCGLSFVLLFFSFLFLRFIPRGNFHLRGSSDSFCES